MNYLNIIGAYAFYLIMSAISYFIIGFEGTVIIALAVILAQNNLNKPKKNPLL
jgi:hypothetical protein